jgi:hypothetical protein
VISKGVLSRSDDNLLWHRQPSVELAASNYS